MVQHQDLVALAGPGVGRDDPRAVDHVDGLGADTDLDPPGDVTGRDRVEAAADRHPGLAVHPVRAHHRGVEALARQRPQDLGFEREMLADGDRAVRDAAPVVGCHGGGEEVVELGHRRDMGDRDEMAATEPADLGLHPALLVAALDPGLAEEAVEAVVASERDEPLGLDAGAALEHLGHRRLQVVVADPVRYAAQVLEAPDVAVEEHGLALVQVGARETLARRRQAHQEQRQLGQRAGQVDVDRAEVDLGLGAQRVVLGDHDLDQRHRLAAADLSDVAAHRRLAHHHALLGDQPLPHSTRRVPLLARRCLVGVEPPVDRGLPRVQHRRRAGDRPARRRHRRRQRLTDVTAMHMEPIREAADRQLLAPARLADLLVELHLRPLGHAPHGPVRQRAPGGPSSSSPTGGAKSDEHYCPRWGQIR